MKKRMALFLFTMLAVISGLIIVTPAQSEEGKVTACDVTVYLSDPDKSGTNVRDMPKGKVLKQLPKYDHPDYKETGIILKIKGSKDNWLQIDSISNYEKIDASYKNAWVSGKLVATGTSNYDANIPLNLYEKPSKSSKIKHKVNEELKFTVLACNGKWVYGNAKVKGKEISGWLEPEKQCSNTLTNCN